MITGTVEFLNKEKTITKQFKTKNEAISWIIRVVESSSNCLGYTDTFSVYRT